MTRERQRHLYKVLQHEDKLKAMQKECFVLIRDIISGIQGMDYKAVVITH